MSEEKRDAIPADRCRRHKDFCLLPAPQPRNLIQLSGCDQHASWLYRVNASPRNLPHGDILKFPLGATGLLLFLSQTT